MCTSVLILIIYYHLTNMYLDKGILPIINCYSHISIRNPCCRCFFFFTLLRSLTLSFCLANQVCAAWSGWQSPQLDAWFLQLLFCGSQWVVSAALTDLSKGVSFPLLFLIYVKKLPKYLHKTICRWENFSKLFQDLISVPFLNIPLHWSQRIFVNLNWNKDGPRR